jgi:hypothetical protein
MRDLSKSFQRSASDQLSRIARLISDDPALPNQDKVAVLYAAIDDFAALIDSLSPSQPESAPELWADWKAKVRHKKAKGLPLNDDELSQNPFSFVKRVYGPTVLLMMLGRVDPKLKRDLYRWEAKFGNDTDVVLVTERAENDRKLALLGGPMPNFDELPASALLQARSLLTLKNLVRMRRFRGLNKKSAP